MQISVRVLMCCGWGEIHGVNQYEGNLEGFVRQLYNDGFVYVGGQRRGALLFTQAGVRSKYGKLLAKDLEAARLGKVQQLNSFKNPNTQRIIVPFMWMIDKAGLQAYCTEKGIFPRK
jgi:hypothetical protein